MTTDIYLYGMIVYSTLHRLAAGYPEADSYGEIEDTQVVPGGETGNSALVLANWGHRVKVAGPFLGRKTREGVEQFFKSRGIDCSALHHDESFDGVRDIVLIAGASRTVFGWFDAFYAGTKRWSPPVRNDVASARVVGIDPYFREDSEEAARLCDELGKLYVTIDCPPDSPLHRGAAVTVISGEFIRNQFPGVERTALLRAYTEKSAALVIFTSGAHDVLFARGRGPVRRLQPCKIVPKSTLGAGDTFRGGVIHALACGGSDEQIVRFASATATSVCRRFPFAFDPPGLEEISTLAASLVVTTD